MTVRGYHAPSWLHWTECWFVVFLLSGAWTVLSLPGGGILASLLFFGLCAIIAVGVARDGGSATPWYVVPVAAIGVTSLLGPLIDETVWALFLAAAMAATTPPVRFRISRR